VGRGARVLLVELGPHDETRPCHARTQRFNGYARRLFDARTPLDAEERRIVETIVNVVRAREHRWPVVERPTTTRRSLVREVLVERLLVPEGRAQYYLNPYVGCVIGCEFCYVAELADLSRALEGLPRLEWGRYVDVKVNAPAILREEVKRLTPGPVRLSPVLTDPYQPIERRFRVTRGCLEVLLEARFTPVVLTRAALVVDDLELLARFPSAAVGFSVPTDDDSIRAVFEPGADPIDERLEALGRCHRAGLRTFAVIQPMLPMDPVALAARLAPHVHAVRIDRMYELDRMRPVYERAGLAAAASDQFFAETTAALRTAFAARGVAVDELDDLSALLGPRTP
jgi:DNA repair photolyase